MEELVVGVTGASGSIYARRLLEVLMDSGALVHLVISPTGRLTWEHELEETFDPDRFRGKTGRLTVYEDDDFFSPAASGSFQHQGMIVIPCSVKSLAEIAHGLARSLLTRSADVCLKERRRLVLVVRETPLSLIHLRNMTEVTEAGAVVMPANPGFYHRPRTVDEMVDFVVGRALDLLGIKHRLGRRWGSPGPDPGTQGIEFEETAR